MKEKLFSCLLETLNVRTPAATKRKGLSGFQAFLIMQESKIHTSTHSTNFHNSDNKNQNPRGLIRSCFLAVMLLPPDARGNNYILLSTQWTGLYDIGLTIFIKKKSLCCRLHNTKNFCHNAEIHYCAAHHIVWKTSNLLLRQRQQRTMCL